MVFRRLVRKFINIFKAQDVQSNELNKNIKKFYSLVKLRNFDTAQLLAESFEFETLAPLDKLLIIKCYLSGTKGVIADWRLRQYQSDLIYHAELSNSFSLKYCETIEKCGFDYHEKIEVLDRLYAQIKGSGGVEELAISWIYYRVAATQNVNNDPIYFIINKTATTETLPFYIKFLIQCRSFGHDSFVDASLDKLVEQFSVCNEYVSKALLICKPEWFNDHRDISLLQSLPLTVATLVTLYPLRSRSTFFENWYEECLKYQIERFPQYSIYDKNSVLRGGMQCDLHKLIVQLSESETDSELMLPTWIAKGYLFFEKSDFHSAYQCFNHALTQDPGDTTAASGLRLTLTRIGFGPKEILNVRHRIGYGVKNSGRTGVKYLGSEYTLALLLSGDYLRGQYSTKNSKNWKELEYAFGSKFLNCEPLPIPESSSLKTIFIIGDSGVGDEIRAAQFYSELIRNFKKVYITCDPRLYNIYTQSFPEIIFIPVERFRRGVSERKLNVKEDSLDKRIVGFDEKVSNYLTERCRTYLNECDFITYSQNLYFNYFLGRISRPPYGSYLNWRPKKPEHNKKNFRIGILWRSHFRTGTRKYMYLDVQEFSSLVNIKGVEIFSVQHCIDDDEVAWCENNNIKLFNGVDLFNDFESTCEVLKTLDLVIGISSVPIELAAALGIEVWMLGFSPENYYLRTAGGEIFDDQYTLNSSVIAPPWIDFSYPRNLCVEQVFEEVSRRLDMKLKSDVNKDFATGLR